MFTRSTSFALLLTLLFLHQAIAQDKTLGIRSLPEGTRKRAAVIFANQDYVIHQYDLQKTYNDANDMKAALERLGFKVIIFEKDLGRVALEGKIRGLGTQLKGYEVVFFYYSGHGSMYNNENFLIPADIPLVEDNGDIQSFGVPLNRVYDALKKAEVKTSIIVSDACRNLVIGKSGPASGMTLPSNNPAGTYTMFATRSGKSARENLEGRNSYFTQELLKHIETPNLSLNQIFDATRRGLQLVTTKKDAAGRPRDPQVPGRVDELESDFVFIQSTVQNTPMAPSIPTRPATTAPTASPQAIADMELAAKAYDNKKYEKAFKLLSTHLQALDPASQGRLGGMYYGGDGVTQNRPEALRWLQKAADQGDALGQLGLFILYTKGDAGLSQDESKAIDWLRKAANQGQKDAQSYLGGVYSNGGFGLTKNDKEAVRWYRLAADQGEANAQTQLGIMYANGEGGLVQNNTEAVRLLRLAAEKGYSKAQWNLGGMHAAGSGGLPEDKKEAVRWYRKAARQGDSFGQVLLGKAYQDGEGIAQSDKEAVHWYRKAAEQGDALGQSRLGLMYFTGYGGLAQDRVEAARLFQQAAEQGESLAQAVLGEMYYQGSGGLPQDDVKAVELYRKAAEQDHTDAQAWLGNMYEFGEGGLTADKVEAVRWYRKAAEKGSTIAQVQLGLLYENGEGGLTKNFREAVLLYQKAASQKSPGAQFILGSIYEKGDLGVRGDIAKAIEYYQLAARQGYDSAQKSLRRLGKTW